MTISKNLILRSTLVAALAATAYLGGARLRDIGDSAALSGVRVSSVPSSMVVKLTPERAPVALDSNSKDKSADPYLVGTVIKRLKSRYVDPITPEREAAMAQGVARGMVDALDDPDSRFLDPKEKRDLDDAEAGVFHGVGAILTVRDGKIDKLDLSRLIVITPVPGSPAAQAGIRPGDSITHVNGKWVITYDPGQEAGLRELSDKVRSKEVNILELYKASQAAEKKLKEGMSIADAVKLLTSDASGMLTVQVTRPGLSKPREFKMRARTTKVTPVAMTMLPHGIAYIRVSQFNNAAAAEFTDQFKRANSRKAKALVLDLRGNPGGSLHSATSIAGRITGGGTLGFIEETKRRRSLTAVRTPAVKLPVAVLVNEGTASVAELAAGALRERVSATIVGTKTFGDGLAQTPLILKDGSAAVITTGRMLTPRGLSFDQKGLQPDKQVESNDSQLKEAQRLLTARIGKA